MPEPISRTVVVSDLHLGRANRSDILRSPAMREPLLAAVRGVQRLVILGDGLELREVALREAAGVAADLLRDLATALGRDGEIVLVPGNHDHSLVGGWIDNRLWQEEQPRMALEQWIEPSEAGPLAVALADAAAPARVRLAYPGLWLRPDVYAFHGHYADVHSTVPQFERLAAGAMARWVAPLPVRGISPDDYENVLAPIYAWIHALAQRSTYGGLKTGAGASARAWVAIAGKGRREHPLRAAAMGAAYVGAVAAINRMGIGPLRRDLSPDALRQGYLHGAGEAVRRLGIDARHVIWGHSHRAGPFPGDDVAEWVAPTGAHLVNTGSWVLPPAFAGNAGGSSPYWPGTAVVVEASGPPRHERLLAHLSRDELRRRG